MKSSVHVLTLEVIEDDRPHQFTQILVLKRFNELTERGGYRWVLAQVYHHLDDKDRRWRGPLRILPPVLPGEKMPNITSAQMFGYEFYDDPPIDKQVEKFLRETMWRPTLGAQTVWGVSGREILISKLADGGIDRMLWKSLFERDVPTPLFPELKLESPMK